MYNSFLLATLCVLLFMNSEAFRDGNRRLKMCCARQKDADKACKRKFCDFSALNADNLGAFVSTCAKGNTIMRLWDCASSRTDHTNCCRAKNVQPHCLVYCNARKIIPADQRYLACFSSISAIKDCFRQHLDNNPNIFGDL